MHPHFLTVRRSQLFLQVLIGLATAALPVQAAQPVKGARARRQQDGAEPKAQAQHPGGAPSHDVHAGAGQGKKAPIMIQVVGNHIVVQSDDPQALAVVQEMVRSLTEGQGGEGHFDIIHLQNANATDAAKILDEALNGPRPPAMAQNPVQVFFSRRFNGTPAPQPTAKPDRVRVIADPDSNSLLVRASPLDMLEIRHLIASAIDVQDTQSKAIIHTYLIGPLHYANATDVAAVLRNVFKEQMDQNPAPSAVAGMSRRTARRLTNLNVDVNGNARAVTLTVGVDDRTNSLIVGCAEKMHEDIKKLVDNLELAAKDSTKTVKVVALQGIDPSVIQEAVDVIQGRRPSPSNNRSGMRPGYPNSGPGNSRQTNANGR